MSAPGVGGGGRPPGDEVVVRGEGLTIDEVIRVARLGARVRLTDDRRVLERVQASCDYVARAVDRQVAIYGVTTSFGGMADTPVSAAEAAALQDHLILSHKSAAGPRLPVRQVRGAMLLRMNSHARGASGLRLEIIRRLETFLNAAVTPHVHEFGSIGASGDLVPLAYITGALIGLDPSFTVDFDGVEMDSATALSRLGLPRLRLRPKEGLAMINGTSMMASVAVDCLYDAQVLLAVAMGAHALIIQALQGTNQSFHPFLQRHKPHPGQSWAAAHMLELLSGSRLARDELDGRHDHRATGPIQDRYSLRCLPQYMGPIVEGLDHIARQVEIEINSATDNPLIDVDREAAYHGGNFLGQYIGIGMDQLRYYIGLLAKHLDVQIALLVAPEFNHGLPASLVGNTGRRINTGLKGLQLTANSIMPLLTFFGNSLVDRFPTHAEQFNQNINSLGFGSANLARQATDVFRQYVAVALVFAAQAVDLRTHAAAGHFDARACLSPASARLYAAVREVVGVPITKERPYVWDDGEHPLDASVAAIAEDIACGGRIGDAVRDTMTSLRTYATGLRGNGT